MAIRTIAANEFGTVLAAGVAVGIPKDKTKIGVIMEDHYGYQERVVQYYRSKPRSLPTISWTLNNSTPSLRPSLSGNFVEGRERTTLCLSSHRFSAYLE
ncbi:hypothetical protein IJG98_03470 [Candidatus Saccharibacteria bacterium]|nr:hypothetical protein [Candidatus Saccharibacteria bacterium]